MGLYIADCPDLSQLHGKTVFCSCEEGQDLRQRRVSRLRKISDLPPRAEQWSFETYRALTLSSEQQLAVQLCETYAQHGEIALKGGEVAKRGLYLYGPVGTGKSGLAVAVANVAMAHGNAVLYRTVPDLLDYIRQTFKPDNDAQYDEVLDRIKEVDLLVLDDLGTERLTDWVLEKLYQIVDYRYRNDMRLIVTSNYPMQTLTRHFNAANNQTGQRLVDRIVHLCALVQVAGTNLRR